MKKRSGRIVGEHCKCIENLTSVSVSLSPLKTWDIGIAIAQCPHKCKCYRRYDRSIFSIVELHVNRLTIYLAFRMPPRNVSIPFDRQHCTDNTIPRTATELVKNSGRVRDRKQFHYFRRDDVLSFMDTIYAAYFQEPTDLSGWLY